MVNLVVSPSNDPYFNTALEEILLGDDTFVDGITMLLYRNAPCVVCGKHQNIFQEVSILDAHNSGIRLVRRMSGGGTVYHDLANVNYTIIADTRGRAVSYAEYICPVVRALNEGLGIAACMGEENDIRVFGKKVSGSAQRKTSARTLHHGTLLFDSDLDSLNGVLRHDDVRFSTTATMSKRSEVANIRDYLPSDFDTDAFMEWCAYALPREFLSHRVDAVSVAYIDGAITENAGCLRDSKYATWDFIYASSPSFECCRELKNGMGIMKYRADKAVISDFSMVINGFECDVAKRAFSGVRLCIDDVLYACECFLRITDACEFTASELMTYIF